MSTQRAQADVERPDQEAPPPGGEPGRFGTALAAVRDGSGLLSLLAVVLALVVGAVLIAVADPRVQETATYLTARPSDFFSAVGTAVGGAYTALLQGAVVDWTADTPTRVLRPLTETLTVATPLIGAGLGVAPGFRAGLFNIGAQGQIIVGAVLAAYVGFALDLPVVLHLVVALVGGVVGGALWGGVAGGLKARTGAHEVIVTIMLNYVALRGVEYLLTLDAFQREGQSNPISPPVADSAHLPLLLGPGFRLHAGFLLVLLAAVGVWWLLERSTTGFALRAVGANPAAARTAGISVPRSYVTVMLLSGALAGLAGAVHLLGTEDSLTAGVAGSFGFDAITVALLGRSRPGGVVLAGLLFGALQAGGVSMQARTGTPVDIVLVVQSLIVLFIAAPPLVRGIFRLREPQARGASGARA
ncbi:ABC transporter permease [Pseudokineococcus basanitobsidens]|uniref:ABC transporter permease n=1 Tax=Pseudokineococcus basanitobsidens TaxID=1926649 RepID=A0ABU8RH97_9ACTN